MQLLVKINKETQEKIYNFGREEKNLSQKNFQLIEAQKCINEDVVLDGELLVWDFNKNKPKTFRQSKEF